MNNRKIPHIPLFVKTHSKKGESPGTLTHIGKKKVEKPTITIWRYDESKCDETVLKDIKELPDLTKYKGVTWINVDGIDDTRLINTIGMQLNLHSLLLEDIVNTSQRPKIEEFEDCLFAVIKILHLQDENGHVGVEHISLILKDNIVVSLQEQPEDAFDPTGERLRKGLGKIRKSGADYLFYRLFDAVVDSYFAILNTMGDRIEDLEEDTMSEPSNEVMTRIYQLRQQVLFARKTIQPMRDVVGSLNRSESVLIQKKTRPFFRDLQDHAIQATDTADTYRELLANMLDNYLSVMSHRMNTVMKTLTVVSTIFIPLTFIVGVYGMNFHYMPELELPWGYPAVWGGMMLLTIVMLVLFKWKKWW
ncbi:magnesium and cobalt transport protein CorA [Candidatus Peregrinibacteria bacterium CG10_big_fil_rev_8_21_14_0_10_49_24]|nr:MAG: magnesium and cobalt transport protein CorA [Candidatus Peregrinibacteria bacterium CG11_big_fil_rev_8_21_14_0_20_49_14]PIR51371.1 MAG: magnesium and cobalt transport protein CorA [Candidatus Peregrinibacteria bacterium CG10_big_fil_rev_8_21_14_0_10_49_24]PJA68135.1 MAG: magnesium and cobalt transport protein CorA [Candidatus Peregrinibacteria bacterium CG_4_9_14_3_um_filter_49_12]